MRHQLKEENKGFVKNDFARMLIMIAMFSLILFMVSGFLRSMQIKNEKLKILELVEEDVEKLRMDNLVLILEKNEIISYEYIEKEARDKLRYSRDGETVFVIPEDLMSSELLDAELKKAKGEELLHSTMNTQDIVNVWIDFLFVSGV